MKIEIAEQQRSKAQRSRVFLTTGFRPFFLLAALHAVLAVPLWLAMLRGRGPSLAVEATGWHAHEMVYGFAAAVIAGFLLTAVQHWTGGRPTAKGAGLAALALLWIAGRVAMLGGTMLPLGAVAAVNLAFLPALGFAVGRPILQTRNRRNYKVLAILALLWSGQLAFFLGTTGLLRDAIPELAVMRAATLGVVVLCLVITGRIVPLFTRNATGAQGLRPWPAADAVAIGGVLLLLGLTIPGIEGPAVILLSAATGLAVVARMRWWGSLGTLRNPLLWILHLGHLWIALGLLLPLLHFAGNPLAGAASTHALAFGGIGTLILGMMVRVTFGHTGRELRTPKPIVLAFGLFSAGAAARTLLPLAMPAHYPDILTLSGTLWALSFLLYLLVQGPMLLQPRPDGRPG